MKIGKLYVALSTRSYQQGEPMWELWKKPQIEASFEPEDWTGTHIRVGDIVLVLDVLPDDAGGYGQTQFLTEHGCGWAWMANTMDFQEVL